MSNWKNSLVIIKKKGMDGMSIPLDSQDRVLFGRSAEANIRIQKKAISTEHTEITFDDKGLPMVKNLSKTNSTLLNGENLTKAVHLHTGDVITIVDRSFRFVTDRPMPASRTPLVVKSNKKATPKRSALKNSGKAAQTGDENVAKQLEFSSATPKKSASKKRVVKQPLTERRPQLATPVRKDIKSASDKREAKKAELPPPMQTPLKHSIVEKATARESIVPTKSMPTPFKKEVAAKGAAERPAYAKKKGMKTPMKKAIKESGSKPNSVFVDNKKSLKTPVKKAIKEKGGKAKPMFEQKKSLKTPMKKEIKAKGGKESTVFVENVATMKTPLKKEIRKEGAKPKEAYAEKKCLDSPLQAEIVDTAPQILAAHKARVKGLPTPVKAGIPGAYQVFETKRASKAAEMERLAKEKEEAKKAAEAAAAESDDEEEEEEEEVDDAEETVDEDDVTIDEADDESSSEDEIECNLPTVKASTPLPVSARRLATPMRKAIATRGAASRPAYLKEHVLPSPMKRSIVTTASAITETHNKHARGLPTPVKRSIGPGATDFALRMAAQKSSAANDMMDKEAVAAMQRDAEERIAAANKMAEEAESAADDKVNEALEKAAEAKAEAEAALAAVQNALAAQQQAAPQEPADTQVSMLSVDVSKARGTVDELLSALEGKLGTRGYTKAKMEADVVEMIKAVRGVFDELEQAQGIVEEDVAEKAAAMEEVCGVEEEEEESIAEEEVEEVEEEVEEKEESEEEEEEESEEEEEEVVVEVKAPRGRRGRKSMPATTAKKTTRGTRGRKSVVPVVNKEESDNSEEEQEEETARRSSRRTRARK